jgi:hypothetical protein
VQGAVDGHQHEARGEPAHVSTELGSFGRGSADPLSKMSTLPPTVRVQRATRRCAAACRSSLGKPEPRTRSSLSFV